MCSKNICLLGYLQYTKFRTLKLKSNPFHEFMVSPTFCIVKPWGLILYIRKPICNYFKLFSEHTDPIVKSVSACGQILLAIGTKKPQILWFFSN
jgi:hypothetical protein